MLTVFLGHLVIALVVGPNGWDDGAITLAFAQTFADTGHIALTPTSETVEGFSSPFWFLLMALTQQVFDLGFLGLITASQIWSAACASAGAVLTFRLVARRIDRVSGWVSAAALFLSAPFLNETMNGMEMAALTLVILVVATLLDADRYGPLIFAAACVGPLVRLEATGYLVVSAAGILLLSRSVKPAVTIGAGALASFTALTLGRMLLFDSWLPNTMLAKRWPPYSPTSGTGRASSSFLALAESVLVLLPTLLLGLAVVAITALSVAQGRNNPWDRLKRNHPRPAPALAFLLSYVLAVVAFNVAIGKNTGYPGRMELSSVAPFFVLVIAVVGTLWSTRRTLLALATVVFIASTVVTSWSTLQWTNLSLAIEGTGGSAATDQITPANYRETGLAAESVRGVLGESSLTFMTPDIGGSALCCARLRIVDLAMLANTELAARGYSHFDAYLRSTSPDLIETHGGWAEASAIYDSHFFRQTYLPIVSNETWLYIRNDHMAAIAPRCQHMPIERTGSMRYRGIETDDDYVRSRNWKRVCVVS